MSEVTQAQFFDAVQTLRDQIDDRHKSLRASMEHSFDTLTQKLDAHIKDDNAVAGRVLVMETERKGEAAAATKRGTIAGIVAAAGLSGLLEIAKAIWKL